MQIYDVKAFLAWQHHALNAGMQREAFYYPPMALLLSSVISWLPFECGFLVWTAIWLGLSIWLLRRAGMTAAVIIFTLLSPAALWNFELGQLGLIGGAALVAGLFLEQKRTRLAAAALGFSVFKPQAGLLIPAVLLARRDLKTFLWAAIVVLSIMALSLALFGTQAWQVYLTMGRAVSQQVLQVPFENDVFLYNGQSEGVSVFWMMRSFGFGLPFSYSLQLMASIGAMISVWFVWRTQRFGLLEQVALTVMLSLLATPYGYTDDMVGYSIVLTALAETRRWRIDLLDGFLWLWPALCPVVVMRTGLLFTPLIVTMAAAQVLWRTWRSPAKTNQMMP